MVRCAGKEFDEKEKEWEREREREAEHSSCGEPPETGNRGEVIYTTTAISFDSLLGLSNMILNNGAWTRDHNPVRWRPAPLPSCDWNPSTNRLNCQLVPLIIPQAGQKEAEVGNSPRAAAAGPGLLNSIIGFQRGRMAQGQGEPHGNWRITRPDPTLPVPLHPDNKSPRCVSFKSQSADPGRGIGHLHHRPS